MRPGWAFLPALGGALAHAPVLRYDLAPARSTAPAPSARAVRREQDRPRGARDVERDRSPRRSRCTASPAYRERLPAELRDGRPAAPRRAARRRGRARRAAQQRAQAATRDRARRAGRLPAGRRAGHPRPGRLRARRLAAAGADLAHVGARAGRGIRDRGGRAPGREPGRLRARRPHARRSETANSGGARAGGRLHRGFPAYLRWHRGEGHREADPAAVADLVPDGGAAARLRARDQAGRRGLLAR